MKTRKICDITQINKRISTATVLLMLLLMSFSYSFVNGFDQSRSLTVSNETQINDDLGSAVQARPELAYFSSWIYTTWQDKRNGDFDIFFSRSSDSGLTWGSPGSDNDIKLNDDQSSIASQQNPEIGINSAGVIFIVWEDYRFGNWDIFMSSSNDNGASWSTNIAINGTDEWSGNQRFPRLEIDGIDFIYIAFENDAAGFNNIEVVRSINSGSTFSTPETLAGTLPDRNRSNADICSGPENSIYVVWVETIDAFNSQIYLVTMDGSDWPGATAPVRIDDESVDIIKMHPSIELDESGDLFVAWLENALNRYNILFDRSFDEGETFYSDITVNSISNSAHSETEPDVLVNDEGIVYVAWIDVLSGNHIVISDSVNGGLSFDNETTVDSTTRGGARGGTGTRALEEKQERLSPALTEVGSDLYIVWEDYRDDPQPSNQIPENGDIYFAFVSGLSNHAPPAVKADAMPLSWNAIQLNWTESNEPDFKQYSVQISIEKNFESGKIIETIAVNERLSNSHIFSDLPPDTEYYFRVTIIDDGGYSVSSAVVSAITLTNQPPVINFLEPDGNSDFADQHFILKWTDDDPDDNARIQLFYNNDLLGEEFLDTVNENDDGAGDSYIWDTADLPDGDYYIKLAINDTFNTPVVRLSEYPVIVNHEIDKSPPEVTGLFPSELEEEVPPDSMIVVYFNEPLNESSVQDSMTLHSSSTGKVDGLAVYDPFNTSIVFKPSKPLQLDTWYDVTINSAISDLIGNEAQIHTSWKFKTASIEVLFVYPENGSTDIPQDRDLVIIFSESMNVSSVEQSFIIQPSTNVILFNWSLNGSKLIIHHDIFVPDTNYSLSLGPRLKSKYGAVLKKRQTLFFRTGNTNIAPELRDHGFFKLDSVYMFYVEYHDFNNDAANLSVMHLYREDGFEQIVELDEISRDSESRLSNFYEPDAALVDGNYSNGEIFLVEQKLEPGEYLYYFEFEDIHGTKAVSDTVPLDFDDSVKGPLVKTAVEDESSSGLIITAALLLIIIISVLIVYFFVIKKTNVPGRDDCENGQDPEADDDVDDIKIDLLKPQLKPKSRKVQPSMKKGQLKKRKFEDRDD